MGDGNRASIFAKFMSRNFQPCRVADIAGGRGGLSKELKKHHFISVVIDPCRGQEKNTVKIFQKVENVSLKNFDLLVGMHPDEATEYIIKEGLRLGKAFAVVPCCSHAKDGLKKSFTQWIKYLKSLEPFKDEIRITVLKMGGKNLVLYRR